MELQVSYSICAKYRRKVFYEEKRAEIREVLRQLCEWKGVEIIEGEVCPDHIHMLVSIPPKIRDFGMQISCYPIFEIFADCFSLLSTP